MMYHMKGTALNGPHVVGGGGVGGVVERAKIETKSNARDGCAPQPSYQTLGSSAHVVIYVMMS